MSAQSDGLPLQGAANPLTVPLWRDLPVPDLSQMVNEVGHIAKVACPSLTVMVPDRPRGGSVLICPGGGYTILDWYCHVTRPAQQLLQRGYTVLGLRYRLSPPSVRPVDDAMRDLAQALALTVTNASAWKLVPGRTIVVGFSAGAHTILSLLSAQSRGLGLLSSASMPRRVGLMCPWPNGQKAEDFAMTNVVPPAFIAAAEDDQVSPPWFISALESSWRAAGRPVRVARFATGGHLAFNYQESGPAIDWLSDLLEWCET